MSIGKILNEAALVKNDDPTQVKTVRVTKGILDRENSKFTVTEWGDDIFDWAFERKDERWLIGGLSGAVVLFDIYVGNERHVKVYLAGQEAGSAYAYNAYTRENPKETEQWKSFKGFQGGCGLYLFYDGTTNPEKPTYFFIGAPVAVITKRAIVAHPVPYEHPFTQGTGYVVNDLWYPYISHVPYNDKIFRDYSVSDYDPGKANPTTIQGFPFGIGNNGESSSKGGQGDMVDENTPILIDEPRTLFVGNLFRVYNMTVTALSELSNFLLDPSFTSSVSKLFNDPMDYLTSLVAIPFSFGGNDETITIGSVSSNISAKRLDNFIADLDCGEINFIEYFQTFMDYSPYTRVTIYLPMIGYVNINVDAFQNDKLSLKYRIDVLTGQCVAFLSNSKGLVASYNGNCAYHIPLRSRDYSQMISGIANTAASTLIGGVSAPSFNGALNGALNFKPAGSVTTAGAFSGNCGVLTNKKPYIIIERPHISIPRTYPNNIGYMSRITAKLGDLTGYTVVEEIHLEHISATDDEKRLIENALKSGVIL